MLFRRFNRVVELAKGKKGKGSSTAAVTNDDVLNIYKDKPDIELKGYDEYPSWLPRMVMMNPNTDVYKAIYQNYEREFYPEGREWSTYISQQKRDIIKMGNNSNLNKAYDFGIKDEAPIIYPWNYTKGVRNKIEEEKKAELEAQEEAGINPDEEEEDSDDYE